MSPRSLFAALVLFATTSLFFACTPAEKQEAAAGEKKQEAAAAAEPSAPAAAAPEAQADEPSPAANDAPAAPQAEATAAPQAEATAEAAPAPDDDRLAPGETRHFGGEFTLASEPLELAAALEQIESLVGQPVKVAANVEMACRKKGCWMTLVPPTEGAQPLRVTFKDYKFFVPKYADGSRAVIEGEFVRETLSEATRRHLARDAGKSDAEVEAITGDEHLIQFVATAVDLTGPSTAAAP